MGRRPGRPVGGRLSGEVRQQFWDALRTGLGIGQAAAVAGVSAAAGSQWVAQAGGVLPKKRPYAGTDNVQSCRLRFEDRSRIELLGQAGRSMAEIARVLARPRSTISREVARCGGLGRYRALAAQGHYEQSVKRPKQPVLCCRGRLLAEVVAKLKRRLSPEQIAGRLRREFPDDPEMWVSHETIYQAIYVNPRGELSRTLKDAIRDGKVLRTGRDHRKTRGRTPRRSPIADPVSISERPAEAEDRAVPGHWEGDLIIGKNGLSAIGTTVERTSGFFVPLHLPHDHTAPTLAHAISTTLGVLPDTLKRSLTWDRGGELAQHKQITTTTGLPVFFADPYSPWQRGSNENLNGLLRQYFPKGTDLSVHTAADLTAVADELNNRPRKRLGWATPAEVLAYLLEDPARITAGPPPQGYPVHKPGVALTP